MCARLEGPRILLIFGSGVQTAERSLAAGSSPCALAEEAECNFGPGAVNLCHSPHTEIEESDLRRLGWLQDGTIIPSAALL